MSKSRRGAGEGTSSAGLSINRSTWEKPELVVEDQFFAHLSPDWRLFHRLSYDGKMLVDFALELQVLDEGRWVRVIRYDCAHGTVHRDTYTGGQQTKRSELFTISRPEDISDGWDVAVDRIHIEWVKAAERRSNG